MRRAVEIIKAVIAVIGLVIAIVLLPGCVERVKYVTMPLYHEPRPVLPRVSAKELECLSKETYQKLFDRQRLIMDYTVILETIIDNANGTPTGR